MEEPVLKKRLIAILEMIEDKEFPARRNITDYVELIIGSFDHDLGKYAEKVCNEFYKERDKK